MGRPSKKTPKVVETICEQLSKGVPLTVICEADGMPDPSTVRDWINADPAVSRAIARAREAGEDALAEQCLTIADTPAIGVAEKYERILIDNPDDPEGEQVEEFRLTERRVEDMLGHRKLQIDTRLKLLAKFNPKRWGDRMAVDHGIQDNLAERMKAARERSAKR